ncbi:hypothetical protein NC653_025402 [Populus alba x Populus x berolinensis]|uniref:Uncharacterized protein n=1 Tax=Populus alba x Populus x berolinensis TaxID=444605 RepID=A0AAD6MB71_9ROSI|nr:hypothetical protein NC653_025402 [Populus alba x Populus x berolinensis]
MQIKCNQKMWFMDLLQGIVKLHWFNTLKLIPVEAFYSINIGKFSE